MPIGRPASELPQLTQEEILRYSRHLIIPDVGVEGQRRLKDARAEFLSKFPSLSEEIVASVG